MRIATYMNLPAYFRPSSHKRLRACIGRISLPPAIGKRRDGTSDLYALEHRHLLKGVTEQAVVDGPAATTDGGGGLGRPEGGAGIELASQTAGGLEAGVDAFHQPAAALV